VTDAKEVGWGTLGETFRHRAHPFMQKAKRNASISLNKFIFDATSIRISQDFEILAEIYNNIGPGSYYGTRTFGSAEIE
jgi:hypothetical protein